MSMNYNLNVISVMSSFFEDLDTLFQEAGIDPEKIEVPDENLAEHLWRPIRLVVFSNDSYEWKCKCCGRMITIKKFHPPKPPEPDYSNVTDKYEAAKIRHEYDKIMKSYEETKESLSHMETVSEALKREKVDASCAIEVITDISNC